MEWYMGVLKKYAEFGGRARRKEYWMFTLFNILIGFALGIVEGIIGTGGLLAGLYTLAILVPSIAVTVRRLHDTGRSGWWILIALVPIVGWLVLLVFMVLDGEPGDNAWGANPKSGTAVTA